ncbi:MAG: Na+/H+ antiporter subunit E [Microbacteriaceae bacterium]
MTDRDRSVLRRNALRQLPYAAWLIVLWLALWGQLTILALVTGVLVAALVLRFFYLPPAEAPGRFNLYRFVILASRFALDLMQASFQVAWAAIRPQPVQTSSIIQVDLRTRSDLIMTLTAEAITLIPGSFVVEIDRENTILYLHVLDANTVGEIERMRQTVFAQEERIIRAVGSMDDVRRIQRWHEHHRGHPGDGPTPVRPAEGA